MCSLSFPALTRAAIERMQQMEELGRGATVAVEEKKIEEKSDKKVEVPRHRTRLTEASRYPCPTARSA